MGLKNDYAPLGVAVVLAVILQLTLIAVDCRQTPLGTAEKFAKHFLYLDPAMQDQLCSQLAARGEAVGDYLYLKRFEAGQRGFGPQMTRRMFTAIHLELLSQNDTAAKVHLSGKTRVAINPVFMVLGKLFRIGDTYPVEMTLDLIKEDGRWRVCGQALGQIS